MTNPDTPGAKEKESRGVEFRRFPKEPLRLLVFPSIGGTVEEIKVIWVAQSLEVDLACQDDSLTGVLRRFPWLYNEHLLLDINYDNPPFATLEPAPEKVFDLWDDAIPLESFLMLHIPEVMRRGPSPPGVPTLAEVRISVAPDWTSNQEGGESS